MRKIKNFRISNFKTPLTISSPALRVLRRGRGTRPILRKVSNRIVKKLRELFRGLGTFEYFWFPRRIEQKSKIFFDFEFLGFLGHYILEDFVGDEKYMRRYCSILRRILGQKSRKIKNFLLSQFFELLRPSHSPKALSEELSMIIFGFYRRFW